MLMNVLQHIPLCWNMADPIKPLPSYSAQINFDITIWNGLCSVMHGQYMYLVSLKKEDKLNCVNKHELDL